MENTITELNNVRNQIESIRDNLRNPSYSKVRNSLSSALCSLKKAIKDIEETRPLEGQLRLEDVLGSFNNEEEYDYEQ